jgi:glycosyltransferase involved in cell wall biosynthesis
MPYIVLETAAAGLPIVSTNVGGIPDIFGPQAARLLPPNDLPALIDAIRSAVKTPETMKAPTAALRERVRSEFSIERMVDGAIAGYREALRLKSSKPH